MRFRISSRFFSSEDLAMSKLPFMSENHHFAIASVAVRAAQLDNYIELLISVVLWTREHTCRFLLKNLNGDKYVDLTKHLLLDSVPNHQADIEEIFSKIKELRNERNELLHWLWGKSEDITVAKYAQIRPFRERKIKTKTAVQIQIIAEDFLLMINLLMAWMEYVQEAQQPSFLGTRALPIPPPNWASAKSADRPLDVWLRARQQKPYPK